LRPIYRLFTQSDRLFFLTYDKNRIDPICENCVVHTTLSNVFHMSSGGKLRSETDSQHWPQVALLSAGRSKTEGNGKKKKRKRKGRKKVFFSRYCN
jgi:hypothetical protein